MDVQLPNGQVVKGVPDGTTKAQLAEKLQANGVDVPSEWLAPEQPNTWGQAGKNVAQAGAHLGTAAIGSVLGDVAGIASLMAPPAMIARKLGYENGIFDPASVREKVSSALTYTPENQDTLSMKIASAPGKAVQWSGQKLADPVRGVPYLETFAENLPVVGANALGLAGAKALGRGPKPAIAPAPTTAELGKAATAAYKRADDSGIAVKPESFGGMKAKLSDALNKDGLDADLHPNSTAAMKRIMAEEGPVTLQKLETLRRIALDAEDTPVKSDARKAGDIVDSIDEYVDNLSDAELTSGQAKDAAALKEARALYTRKRKAEDIERLIRRAEYSPSGFENGLRIEFRSLAKNDRRFNRFTPEEKAAIDKVAKGGAAENILRLIGKAAPTGIVSGGLSSGAGFAFGGPIGAVAVPALGIAGRVGSKALTNRNAKAALETMQRGPTPSAASGGGGAIPTDVAQALLARSQPRAASAIQADIQQLVQKAGSQAGGPASPQTRAIFLELERLEAELKAAQQRELSQGASGAPLSQ